MKEERVVAQQPVKAETEFEATLRPRFLGEFIGQPLLQERLRVSIEAAAKMGVPMGHVLFSGPPGLGKTSMAGVIAEELGANMRRSSGPALDRPGDLASILSGLERGDIFFVDELHRLSRLVEEVLYPAMEDYALDIVVGRGGGRHHLPAQTPALHPGGRHHPVGDDLIPPAGPFPDHRAFRLLHARGTPPDSCPFRRDSGGEDHRRGGGDHRRPEQGNRPGRQPAPDPMCATTRLPGRMDR